MGDDLRNSALPLRRIQRLTTPINDRRASDIHTPSDRRYTFPKTHRLKRRRLIRALFDRRRDDVNTVAVGVVRLIFRVAPHEEVGTDVPLQIGFAPGRCPTAVARNRVRRLLREHYRMHQHVLTDLFRNRDEVLTMMALFRGNPEQPAPIRRDLPRALQRAAEALQDDGPPTTNR